MIISIEIPKEFKQHFGYDKFVDSLARLCADIESSKTVFSGLYEKELLKMLRDAFGNAKVIKE